MSSLREILDEFALLKIKKTKEDKGGRIFLPREFQKSNSKQVVIKLISNLNRRALNRVLSYLTKSSTEKVVINEKDEAVDPRLIAEDWKADFLNSKEKCKDIWHLVFSIDEKHTPASLAALKKSVSETMTRHFGEYKYFMVLHDHQEKPHVHVVVNKVNRFTKKRLHFDGKKDMREFFGCIREDFASALNYYGPFLKHEYKNFYKWEKDLEAVKLQEQANELQNNLDFLIERARTILSSRQERLVVALQNNENNYEEKKQESGSVFLALEKMKTELISSLEKTKEERLEACQYFNRNYKNLTRNFFSIKETLEKIRNKRGELLEEASLLKEAIASIDEEFDGIASSAEKISQSIAFLSKNRRLSLAERARLDKASEAIARFSESLSVTVQERARANSESINGYALGGFKNTFEIIGTIREIQKNMEHLTLAAKNRNDDGLQKFIEIQKSNESILKESLLQKFKDNLKEIDRCVLLPERTIKDKEKKGFALRKIFRDQERIHSFIKIPEELFQRNRLLREVQEKKYSYLFPKDQAKGSSISR